MDHTLFFHRTNCCQVMTEQFHFLNTLVLPLISPVVDVLNCHWFPMIQFSYSAIYTQTEEAVSGGFLCGQCWFHYCDKEDLT